MRCPFGIINFSNISAQRQKVDTFNHLTIQVNIRLYTELGLNPDMQLFLVTPVMYVYNKGHLGGTELQRN